MKKAVKTSAPPKASATKAPAKKSTASTTTQETTPPARRVLQAVVPLRPVHPEPRNRAARAPAPAQNILDSSPHESIDPGMLGNDDVHDETDYAQWMQLVEQAEIAKRAREMSRVVVDPDFDGVHCVDCDCEIPPKRLEHGFDRCVDCKQAIEDEQARQKRLSG